MSSKYKSVATNDDSPAWPMFVSPAYPVVARPDNAPSEGPPAASLHPTSMPLTNIARPEPIQLEYYV
ncbi:hypothetical protein BDV93DRAFT_86069 [Ceratobasidium sp. AG-I]|nr:hypothetical protein BDV93DRAFT_86069 [Ceratobasidium sp. AG-I]